MNIALLCPTRNRLNKLLTLISSLLTTVNDPSTVKLVLGVDEDDPVLSYYSYLKRNVGIQIEIIKFENGGKFLGLSTMWNKMAKDTLQSTDIFAMIGDDMVFSTRDWDQAIIKEFKNGPADKLQLVFCNDGMRGPGNSMPNIDPFPVNFFVHKNYVNLVGYFVEPYVENIHQDTWAYYVFSKCKRLKYRHDILIKHLHFSITNDKVDNVSLNLEKLREGIWDNNSWATNYSKELTNEINLILSTIREAT